MFLMSKLTLIKTLIELGIEENNIHVSNKTQDYYNPGRSGSINLNQKMVHYLLHSVKFIHQ